MTRLQTAELTESPKSPTEQMLSPEASSHDIIQYLNHINNQLEQILIENYGEIDEIAESLIEKIDAADEIAEVKAQRIAHVYYAIDKAKAYVEGQRKHHYEQYKKAQQQKKYHENAQKRLTTKMAELMLASNVKSFEIGGKRLSLGTSYKLEVYDETKALESLPKEFVKTSFSIKKKDLKDHLDNSNDVSYEGVRIAKSHHIRGL